MVRIRKLLCICFSVGKFFKFFYLVLKIKSGRFNCPPIVHKLSKRCSGVCCYFYQDSRSYVGNLVTDVGLQLLQGPGVIHINAKLQKSPLKVITRGQDKRI